MRAFQNVVIGVAVVVIAMTCMVFGDWLASRQRQPNYYYCQNAETPQRRDIATPQEDTAPNQKESRETANQRNHELCQQWRSAQAAEETTRVAWIQLWFGIVGLMGLVLTVIFAAQSARAARDAALQTAKAVNVEMRNQQCVPFVRQIKQEVSEDDEGTSQMLIEVAAQNLGQRAGILVSWSLDCALGEELPPEPEYRIGAVLRGYIWAANNDYIFRCWLDAETTEAITERHATVHLWGYIRCEDVFGIVRKTGFAYVGHPFSDEPGDFRDISWLRAGGKAYNYDQEEPGS